MHLTRELARAERLKSEVSLLVMDLDNFKDINDTYGHHVGDRALREVAGVLRAGDPALRHLRPLRRRRVHRRAVGVRRRGGGAQAAGAAARRRQPAVRGAARQDAAARDQHRRGGLPARRRHLRDAAGDGRQPDVPRQDPAQARSSAAATAPRTPTSARSSVRSPTSSFRRPLSESSGSVDGWHRRPAPSTCHSASDSFSPSYRSSPDRSREPGPEDREPRRANDQRQTFDPPRVVAAAEFDPGGRSQRAPRPTIIASGPPPHQPQDRAARATQSHRAIAYRAVLLTLPIRDVLVADAAGAHRAPRSGRARLRLRRGPGGARREARTREAKAVLDRVGARGCAARRLARAARRRRSRRLAGRRICRSTPGRRRRRGSARHRSPFQRRPRNAVSSSSPAAPASRRCARCCGTRSPSRIATSGCSTARGRREEFAFERELRRLAAGGDIELRQTVTRASEAEWTGARGRIDARRARRARARSGDALFRLRAAGAGRARCRRSCRSSASRASGSGLRSG